MAYFELVSDRDVLVDGIGLLQADEPRKLTKDEETQFSVMHGKRVSESNFPKFVTVTAHLGEGVE